MIMAMGMGIGLVLIYILCLVFFLIVLIKLFKNEGALKGILGFFCSIYTFIWGWMKHKELGMTKLMATWSILTVAGIVMVPVMGVSTALMIPKYLQEMSEGGDIKFSNVETSKKNPKFKMTPKNKKVNSSRKRSKKNEDWGQKAVALWEGDKYKDPNKAVDYWSRAISGKHKTAAAYSNRGIAYHDLRQYQKAVKDYNAAIKMDPNNPATYNNRGNSYYELDEYELALKDFNQSLRLKPQYAKAHLNRGLAYYQMDKNIRACRDFEISCKQGECEGIDWAKKSGICK